MLRNNAGNPIQRRRETINIHVWQLLLKLRIKVVKIRFYNSQRQIKIVPCDTLDILDTNVRPLAVAPKVRNLLAELASRMLYVGARPHPPNLVMRHVVAQDR